MLKRQVPRFSLPYLRIRKFNQGHQWAYFWPQLRLKQISVSLQFVLILLYKSSRKDWESDVAQIPWAKSWIDPEINFLTSFPEHLIELLNMANDLGLAILWTLLFKKQHLLLLNYFCSLILVHITRRTNNCIFSVTRITQIWSHRAPISQLDLRLISLSYPSLLCNRWIRQYAFDLQLAHPRPSFLKGILYHHGS